MKRIAAPMIGGMVTSTVLTLLVIPALYAIWRGWTLPNTSAAGTTRDDIATDGG